MRIIAVDFDGTCVRHEYPEIGAEVPGAVATLRALIERGDRLILWTVRDGAHLAAAVEWFRGRDVALWGINENPEQPKWNGSRKVYANVYLDDAAFGAPLVGGADGRPWLDWASVWLALVGEVGAGVEGWLPDACGDEIAPSTLWGEAPETDRLRGGRPTRADFNAAEAAICPALTDVGVVGRYRKPTGGEREA